MKRSYVRGHFRETYDDDEREYIRRKRNSENFTLKPYWDDYVDMVA